MFKIDKKVKNKTNAVSLSDFSRQNESGMYKTMDLMMIHPIIENIFERNVNCLRKLSFIKKENNCSFSFFK